MLNSCRKILLPALLALLLFAGAAQAERIPRVLYVGDSWTGFLMAYRTLRDVLPEYEGLGRWIEVGNRTAVMGSKAFEWVTGSSPLKDVAAEELQKYPNVDVVVVTLGGNDFSGGTKNVLPWDMGREVDYYNWYEANHAEISRNFNDNWANWTTWYDTDSNATEDFAAEENWGPAPDYGESLLMNKVKGEIKQLVQFILDQRPDIRVVIAGYDYPARWPKSMLPQNANGVRLQNNGLFKMERTKFDIAQELDALPQYQGRVRFVQNLGMMQYTYGYYKGNERANKPWAGVTDPDIPPHSVPLPGSGSTWQVGGDPDALAPLDSYIDKDIHLTAEGYAVCARRFIEDCVETWLNYPKALQITPNTGKADVFEFDVTFSHEVTGVDISDFEVFMDSGKGLKAMSVTAVTPGPADTYTVTVNSDESGAMLIRVLDDDSISRTDNGMLLGGPGTGNGLFQYNGLYEFADVGKPADTDFAGAIGYLYFASQAYEHLLFGFSFNPEKFDANGRFADLQINDEPYIIPGNASLDVYELELIRHCLNNPTLDLSARGGVKAADVIAAWNNNITKMQAALGGAGGLADTILPGLDTVMAGYLTLGDLNSQIIATTLVTMLGEVEEFPTNITPVNPSEYIGMPTLLGGLAMGDVRVNDGDADKDGWANDSEYAYFMPDGKEAYAAAALNPAIVPKTGEGLYEAGDSVRLAVLPAVSWDSTYQWYRNGQPVANNARISGATSRCLNILPLAAGDDGDYTCTYKNSMKQNVTYGPISVRVGAELPVAGIGGLLALASLAGLGGVVALRRRR